jgi:hypothetical protein
VAYADRSGQVHRVRGDGCDHGRRSTGRPRSVLFCPWAFWRVRLSSHAVILIPPCGGRICICSFFLRDAKHLSVPGVLRELQILRSVAAAEGPPILTAEESTKTLGSRISDLRAWARPRCHPERWRRISAVRSSSGKERLRSKAGILCGVYPEGNDKDPSPARRDQDDNSPGRGVPGRACAFQSIFGLPVARGQRAPHAT